MNNCFGCFKPARDPTACIACTYRTSGEIVQGALAGLPPELQGVSDDVIDEARYELMCHLQHFKPEEAKKLMESGLATIIGKCADAALYLPKKRDRDVDEAKIILFAQEFGEAYITNYDVLIRLFDIHPDILDGLNPDIPAYDYLAEKFIPNPLPYSPRELSESFPNEFTYSFLVPIKPLLDWLYHKYPVATERRGTFTVLDIGYGMYDGSLIIPGFSEDPATKRKYFINPAIFGGKPVIVDKGSLLADAAIDPGVPYIGFITGETQDYLAINIYKKYTDAVTFGLFKLMSPALSDDIHPFDLEDYAESDKLHFSLVPELANQQAMDEKMRAFRGFRPIALETDYLFHTLLLLGSFGIEDCAIRVSASPDDPIVIEGLRTDHYQIGIEASMATVLIGEDGRRAEAQINPGHTGVL